jgi:hypothetical protein
LTGEEERKVGVVSLLASSGTLVLQYMEGEKKKKSEKRPIANIGHIILLGCLMANFMR